MVLCTLVEYVVYILGAAHGGIIKYYTLLVHHYGKRSRASQRGEEAEKK